MSETTAVVPGAERELRFAIVLYGGVSLAIYMHGATKELHRLVRASVHLPEVDATPTERAWADLLRAKAAEEDVRTRVVVDIVAGTSAGGINGVYLAKAIAHDLSQEALKDLWFDRGDIGVLLRGPRFLPWKARIPYVLATLPWRTALRGDDMAVWLHDALLAMPPAGEGGGSLLPPAHRLRLFVTMTDFAGYRRDLVLGDPPVISDTRHRHVMEFHHGDGEDDFGARAPVDDVALAFAARATSCFPGAFEPVSFASFAGWLRRKRGVDVDLSVLEERRLFRSYPLAGASAAAAHFVDGGVLDNKPFGHVLRAIREAPASVEVDRRLLYLEPSPTPGPADSGQGAAEPIEQPAPIQTVLASLSGIPRHEPIIDEILDVGRLNERVGQIRDVIETNWEPIADAVQTAIGSADLANPPSDPEDSQLAAWRDDVHKQALVQTGVGHSAYVRVKIGETVDRWAGTLCRISSYPSDCSQASLVRLALREWAREAKLLRTGSAYLTDAQVGFLQDLDLGFGERRLRFLIAGLNWWYAPTDDPDYPVPTREQLDDGKVRLYAALEELQAVQRGDGLPEELRARIDAIFGVEPLRSYLALGADGPDRLIADHAEALAAIAHDFRAHVRSRLAGFSNRVYSELHALTRAWHSEARRQLMLRHLGFPIWDAVLFPLQHLADAGERDAVQLVRLSPLDADGLRPPGRKLEGTRLGNFGAFFTRAGREGDYLWGRLDTAERLVGILLGDEHPERAAWCHRLHEAILDEEEQALPAAAPLIEHLRAQVAATPLL
jgi:patatin-related protein